MFMKYLNEVMPEKEAQDVLSEYVGWLFMPGLKLEKFCSSMVPAVMENQSLLIL